MSEIGIDILDMLDRGESPQYIARILEIPVSWVYETLSYSEDEGNTEVFSPFETCNS
jgi:hypothetical protein